MYSNIEKEKCRPSSGSCCAAINCKNYFNKRNSKETSFFAFPKDKERCEKWIQNTGRVDLIGQTSKELASIKLCNDHFESNQFVSRERKRLVWNAVPTLFEVSNPSSTLTTKTKCPTRLIVKTPNKERKITDKPMGDSLNTATSVPQNKPSSNFTVIVEGFNDLHSSKDFEQADKTTKDISIQATLVEFFLKFESSCEDYYSLRDALQDCVYCGQHLRDQLEFDLHLCHSHTKKNQETQIDLFLFPELNFEDRSSEDVEHTSKSNKLDHLDTAKLDIQNVDTNLGIIKNEPEDFISDLDLVDSLAEETSNGTKNTLLDITELEKEIYTLPRLRKKRHKNFKVTNKKTKREKKEKISKEKSQIDETISCQFCNLKFTSTILLRKHENKLHSEQRYHCSKCAKSFKHKSGLEDHLRVHTGEKPFVCETCGKPFSSRDMLNSHRRRHTGIKKFICNYCSKTFYNKANLSNHIVVHTGEKKHACKVCGKVFSFYCNLTRHMRTHSGIKPHQCDKCKKRFSQKTNLIMHLIKQHNEQGLNLPPSLARLKNGQKSVPRERNYICDVCGQSFVFRFQLIFHLKKKHEGESLFECDICDKHFSFKHALVSHKNTVHLSGEMYECPHCSMTFQFMGGANGYNQHMFSHSDSNKFKCDLCGKEYSSKQGLNDHYSAVHLGLKLFSCNICNRSFTNSSNLCRHKRIHTGEKPYRCSVCDKQFAQKNALVVHHRIHSGEKPFKCNLCPKKYAENKGLLMHMKTHSSSNNEIVVSGPYVQDVQPQPQVLTTQNYIYAALPNS